LESSLYEKARASGLFFMAAAAAWNQGQMQQEADT
jgi:hypothetical protein